MIEIVSCFAYDTDPDFSLLFTLHTPTAIMQQSNAGGGKVSG